jgi:hypothetical protein
MAGRRTLIAPTTRAHMKTKHKVLVGIVIVIMVLVMIIVYSR